MTARPLTATPSDTATPSWWGAMLVGAVFILCGLFALGNVVAATVISAFLIGILLAVAGGSEIFQAFSAQHWRGFFVRLLIGALYAVCGFILLSDPARGSVVLTLIFAWALIGSGIVRIFQSFQYWQWYGVLLLLSGIVGTLAGLMILMKWPLSGLWVLGLVVGIDLVLHGAWWIALGSRLRQDRTAIPA